MTVGQAPVVRADAADVAVLGQVIADAFHDLPPSPWLIADPRARRAIFPDYFQLYVEQALAAGLVHTTPGRAGVAMWIPVGEEPEGPPDGYAERLAAITDPWTERFVAFDEALERAHPAGTPHHHLAILAVRPDQQGRGIGSALLDAYHATLDVRGTPAYLEASSPRNRKLYLRHGYIDRGAPIQLPGGPALYPMWRPSRI